MAKEFYTDETRGIFDKRACVKADGADMQEVFALYVEARKPEAIFSRIEQVARGVLAEHGFPEWPIVHSDGKGFGVRKEADPAARDAGDLLHALATVRDRIAKGDSEWAAAGFRMGRIAERLRPSWQCWSAPILTSAQTRSASVGR